jgi:hypothetical protein
MWVVYSLTRCTGCNITPPRFRYGFADLCAPLPHPRTPCMGLNAIGEFGQRDEDVSRITRKAARLLSQTLIRVLTTAKKHKELRSDADLDSMADFFEGTLAGIRMAAKAGKSRRVLRNIAAFAGRAFMGLDCRGTAARQSGWVACRNGPDFSRSSSSLCSIFWQNPANRASISFSKAAISSVCAASERR